MKKILSLFLAAVILLSSVSISLMFITAAETPVNLITNPSFEDGEDGLNGWVLEAGDSGVAFNGETVTTEKNTGEKSLHRWIGDANTYNQVVAQYVELEADTKYTFSFYIKGWAGWSRFYITSDTEYASPFDHNNTENKALWHQWSGATFEEWTKLSYTFTTLEATDYMIAFMCAAAGIDIYLDDISLVKKESSSENSIIENSGFEDDLYGWSMHNGSNWTAFNAEVVDTEKHTGEKSLHRWVGGSESIYNQILHTPLKLKPQASYTLSFWIKGNPAWGRFYITNQTNLNGISHDNTADKVFWHQWLGTTYSDWTKVSYTFLTKDVTDLLLCFYFASKDSNVYLDDFSLIENDKTNMVANGSFDNDDSGWDFEEPNFTINSDKYIEASKANHKNLSQSINFAGGHMKADFEGWLNQSVSVTKGTRYSIDVEAYLPETETDGCDIELVFAKTIDEIIAGNGTAIELSDYIYGENRWQALSGEYTPDDTLFEGEETKATMCFAVRSKTQNSKLLIDDIKIGTLMGNSDFEAAEQSKVAWKLNNEALKLENITFGQNYKLTFKYKGVNFADNVALWTLSTKTDFDPVNTYIRGFVTENAVDWKENSFVFNSGKNATLSLVFQTLSNEYSLDDIKMVPTSEEVTVEPLNRATLGEVMSGSYYSKFKQPAEGKNVITNDDFTGTATGGYNDALNFVSTENGGTAAGTIVGNGTETGASYLGNSSLKFSAGLEEETVSIPLSLEKNTTYYAALYIKAGPYLADSDGWSRFSYGIGDTSSGNFIRAADIVTQREANKGYADRIQFIPRYDEEWHYAGFQFTTNGQTDLSFMLRGSRMTAYVDKLYIWKATSDDTTDFLATLDKVGPVKNIKAETELLDMSKEGTNLVENFGFENGTDFWEKEYRRVGVYGNNLNIVDSEHNIQKNSFLYENKLLYPWNCYYIQWVDVEPNTNYTFSAKYTITKTGEGFFGVIPGYKNSDEVNEHSENMLYPSNGISSMPATDEADMYIAKWDFTEDNYEENQNWQNVGVTFNSGDRNRIGFFVQDGGGTAYIDDVKLFETKYAVKVTEVDDNFPDKLEVKKGNITVSGGFIKGVTSGTKLSDVANSLKNSEYIRFYDTQGNKITDLNTNVYTGVEVRLMNGPVIKARAKVVIAGDVDGNGIIDSNDAEAIIKHITIENSLEGAYLEAADFDGDGKVTVYDALFNKKAAKTGTSSFTLTGPEKIVIGEDIKISLIADVKDVFALSGRLVFNSDFLTFKSAEASLGDGWKISTSKSDGEIIFAAVNSAKKNGTVKGKAVITFTFTVGNISSIEDIAVGLRDCIAATSTALLTVNNCNWPKTETNEDDTSNNETNTPLDNNLGDDNYSNENSDVLVKAANRLALLKLDEAEISPEFDPEIREYTATVPFEVEKVTVTAIAADENATVTIGDTNLEYIGKNAVTIDVVSADGLKRAYRIIVTREAPTASGDADTEFPLWAIILIIIGAVLLLAAVVFLLIILIKRKRKKTA